jgi:hypothetical protein
MHNGAHERVFDSVSLDTEEAGKLASWMTSVANGEIAPAPTDMPSDALLHFSEPDIRVRVLSRSASSVTSRWYFHHPDALQAFPDELVFEQSYAVDVTVARTEFTAAAESWIGDLQRFLSDR